ncbi:hypothetical protein FKR81_32360 [Lentzea tibetensis]|uniref:Uncharacterized protein n=1 Tax=Lentzea tibetensis TaxID=2591470 RepID=A0A563EKE2_9PSEU|nr:hypothetical protein [Lentzea tibetensis]TWP47409.1 hypothetical protein FKR81_32360 [Lentzea tibetensis]
MARDHARFYLSIWSDEDFIALSALAKIVYVQLCTQQKLTYAGVLDVSVKRWTRAHPDQNIDAVRAALAELDAARFVVIDHDTEELLVRSFIRRDGLYKQPNVLRAALRCAFELESPLLRKALAVELRRLPTEITGPAPAVAATELEAGARELPASVKAAMTIRGTGRPAPAEQAPVPPAPATTTDVQDGGPPSPSAKALGEGSGELETGVVPPALEETQVGVPAPTPAHTGARPRTREAAPASPAAFAGVDDELEHGSVRQMRRAEADRLVTAYCPQQPGRVLDRLRGEVIGLLRDEITPEVIAAGLRQWSAKTLPVTFLPELVGELMRAESVPGTPQDRQRDLAVVRNFEAMRADALAEDDTTPIGRAVRAELPAHTDAATLQAILDRALAETIAASGLEVAA